MNADNRVGEVYIQLGNVNKWDDELITTIISRYTNIYCIAILDHTSSVNRIHGFIKQWVN